MVFLCNYSPHVFSFRYSHMIPLYFRYIRIFLFALFRLPTRFTHFLSIYCLELYRQYTRTSKLDFERTLPLSLILLLLDFLRNANHHSLRLEGSSRALGCRTGSRTKLVASAEELDPVESGKRGGRLMRDPLDHNSAQ